MQYNSWLYLFPFLGGSLILYYLLPIKRRWIGLLFSSLLFYILTMKSLVVVVLFTTAAIYLGARVIEQFNETFKLKKKELDRELKGFWLVGILRVVYEFVKNLILNRQMENRLKNS